MNENEEFADIELTETALMSIAGGSRPNASQNESSGHSTAGC